MKLSEQIEEITKDLKNVELREQSDQDLLDCLDDDFYTLN